MIPDLIRTSPTAARVARLSSRLRASFGPAGAGYDAVEYVFGTPPAGKKTCGLARALAAILQDPAQRQWRHTLAARGWSERVLGYIAGVAPVERGGAGFVFADPHADQTSGFGPAVIAPVFDFGGHLVDAIAIALADGETWALTTGLGMALGKPWPSLDAEGLERPLRVIASPRAWLEAGGWSKGPDAALCPLCDDAALRDEILFAEPASIVLDDDDHAKAFNTWLRRRPKLRALPPLYIAETAERGAA